MDFTLLHLHTIYSLFDSTSSPEDYIKHIKDMGMNAIAFTEHGNVFNWIKKKHYCDDNNIKYIHGVELYMTKTLEEKTRDNYHVILLAKNWEGVKEINRLCSISTDTNHMYYRPRISFDEFLEITDNVLRLSACLGGVLARLDKDDEYNRFLATLNKPLVATTDVHEISKYKLECREIMMLAKGQHYENEKEMDLSLKSYEETLQAFKEQSSLPEEVILEAMENTNRIRDSIEDFELDYSFKYPVGKDGDPIKSLTDYCYSKITEIAPDDEFDSYIDRVDEEIKVFDAQGMGDFMLFMGELIRWGRGEDMYIGPGRGSVTGSLCAYLLGITKVNPMVWDTNFARFANVNRISLGDIDCDFCPKDRAKIYDHIKDIFTEQKSSYIAAFQQMKVKRIIEIVGKAIGLTPDESDAIKKGYSGLDDEMTYIEKRYSDGGFASEKEYDEAKSDCQRRIDEYLSQFDNVFYYYQGLKGALSAFSFHPCGMIGSPIDIVKSIGLSFHAKKERFISQCDMKSVDSLNYTKYDILSLKTLQVIKDTYTLAGLKVPEMDEIEWDDPDVMEDMIKHPVGLFQFESRSAFPYLQKYEPKTIRDIAFITAIIRPSCASFRDNAIKKIANENPTTQIDEVLSDSLGYLVYQEQQIKFLQVLCGFSEGEADVVRRAIGKKDPVLLGKWLPKIESGYIKNSDESEDVARAEVSQFMKVFIDASDYSFSYNHAIAYSIITYMTAYARYKLPEYFIASYCNNASSEDDIVAGTELANFLGVKINNPKYGKSLGHYTVLDGEIHKGIGSVLNVSNKSAEQLKEIADNNPNISFLEFLNMCSNYGDINKTKLETLIRIDFFSSFGKAKKLDVFYRCYRDYSGRKILSKSKIKPGTERLVLDLMRNNTEGFKETKARFTIDSNILLQKIWESMANVDYTDTEKVSWQLSYLSYIQDKNLMLDSIGLVSFYSKKGDVCVKTITGKTKWFQVLDGIAKPKKGDYINVKKTTKKKDGRFNKSVIVSYDVIFIDRKKKK